MQALGLADILQLYLVHSTYDGFLCTRATKDEKNAKPTVIPSKSQSAAVFVDRPTDQPTNNQLTAAEFNDSGDRARRH